MRSLTLKQQNAPATLQAVYSGRDAKTDITVQDGGEFGSLANVRLTNRQLIALRNWIDKKLITDSMKVYYGR